MTTPAPDLVLDASAMVDLLVAGRTAAAIGRRLSTSTIHVPAHFDAEVLSALGRLCRAGELSVDEVCALVAAVGRAPFTRHLLPDLMGGAWARGETLRVADAFYVELAERLDVPLLTTDARLAKAHARAELP